MQLNIYTLFDDSILFRVNSLLSQHYVKQSPLDEPLKFLRTINITRFKPNVWFTLWDDLQKCAFSIVSSVPDQSVGLQLQRRT